jgi:hypothetical protein
MNVELELGMKVIAFNTTTGKIESYPFSDYEKFPGAFWSSLGGRFVFVDLQALSKNIQDGKLSAVEAEKELNDIRNNAEKVRERMIRANTLFPGIYQGNMGI